MLQCRWSSCSPSSGTRRSTTTRSCGRSFFRTRPTTRVQSWPYRLGLSALKAVYMTTGIVHHNLEGFSRGDQQTPLQEVLAGFDVRWDPDRADALRDRHGKTMKSIGSAGSGLKGVPPTAIAPDGSVPVGLGGASAGSIRSVITEPFSTFSHPPVDPPLAEDPTDFDTVLDFHQVITSLNAHRAVQRALGLVFDVELPATFVVPALFPFGTLSIIGATIGEGWNTQTTIPASVRRVRAQRRQCRNTHLLPCPAHHARRRTANHCGNARAHSQPVRARSGRRRWRADESNRAGRNRDRPAVRSARATGRRGGLRRHIGAGDVAQLGLHVFLPTTAHSSCSRRSISQRRPTRQQPAIHRPAVIHASLPKT